MVFSSIFGMLINHILFLMLEWFKLPFYFSGKGVSNYFYDGNLLESLSWPLRHSFFTWSKISTLMNICSTVAWHLHTQYPIDLGFAGWYFFQSRNSTLFGLAISFLPISQSMRPPLTGLQTSTCSGWHVKIWFEISLMLNFIFWLVLMLELWKEQEKLAWCIWRTSGRYVCTRLLPVPSPNKGGLRQVDN